MKHQRTILCIVLRDIQRKLPESHSESPALQRLAVVMQGAGRLSTHKPKDKDKLHAIHAPDRSCISKGKARMPYDFAVKSTLAIRQKQGLTVWARTFHSIPYNGHMLAVQLEQTRIFPENR